MEHTAADLLAKIARVLSSEGIYAVISFRSEPLLRRLFDCRYLPFGPLEHVELRAQSGEPASLYRVRRLAGHAAENDLAALQRHVDDVTDWWYRQEMPLLTPEREQHVRAAWAACSAPGLTTGLKGSVNHLVEG